MRFQAFRFQALRSQALQSRARVAALTLVVLSLGSSVFSQDGLPLLRKMQDALGGADKIAAVRDFEQEVRAQSFNGNTGQLLGEVRKRTRWIRPNYLRVDQVGPGSTYVLFCNGTSGWEILPGTQQVIPLTGGELEFARKYVETFMLKTWLADRDSRFRVTSPTPAIIRISDGDPNHQLDITVDASSSLPVKVSSITLSDPAHPSTRDELTTEWETVQGIRVPHRWTVYQRGARLAEAMTTSTRVNGDLNLADLAATPADLKPLFPSSSPAR
jgi:hypothetical protein